METSKKGRSQVLRLFEQFLFCFSTLYFISSSNVNAQACPGTITYVRNTTLISSGAIPNGASENATCRAACSADDACLSYQLDTNPGTSSFCWLQRTTLSVARPAPNIDEYIKFCQTTSACPIGQIVYISNSTSVSNGATPFPTALNQAACEAACTADSTCLSYQVDSNSDRSSLCWLQKSSLSSTRLATSIYELIKSCSSNTGCIYVANPTLISSGAIANPALTQALCEAACTAESTCLSYQIDSNPGAQSFCWLQRSTLIVARPAPNIIEYIKGPNCGCVFKYAMNASSVSNGAVANPATNQAACEAACTADNTCLSYQLDNSTGTTSFCWLQKTTLSSARPVANIVEYVKYEDCGSTTTATTACPTIFQSNSTFISVGALSFPQYVNQAQCTQACLIDPRCLSFQINSNTGQTLCWLQYTSNAFAANSLWNDPGVKEYLKFINQCSTTTALNTICPTIFLKKKKVPTATLR